MDVLRHPWQKHSTDALEPPCFPKGKTRGLLVRDRKELYAFGGASQEESASLCFPSHPALRETALPGEF